MIWCTFIYWILSEYIYIYKYACIKLYISTPIYLIPKIDTTYTWQLSNFTCLRGLIVSKSKPLQEALESERTIRVNRLGYLWGPLLPCPRFSKILGQLMVGIIVSIGTDIWISDDNFRRKLIYSQEWRRVKFNLNLLME